MKRRTCYVLVAALLCAGPVSATPPANDGTWVHWEFAGWYGGGAYPNIAFDPHVRGRIYLTSDVAGIWRSDDRGETWNFITDGLGNFNVAWIEPAPSAPGVLYAGTKKGVFRSSDSGGFWRPCGEATVPLSFVRPQNYRSAAISSLNSEELAVGTADGHVLLSSDGCRTWRSLGQPQKSPITYAGWSSDPAALFVAGADGLSSYSLSTNAWTAYPDGPIRITDVQVTPSGRVYAAADGELAVAPGMQGPWTIRKVSKKLFRISVLELPRAAHVWGAWNQEWQGGLLVSRNGGMKWKKASVRLKPAAELNPTRQWTGLNGRTNALKRDPFDTQVMFRTDFWGIWRSDDGGRTWNEKIRGAPNTVYSDIVVTDTHIYVAAMDAGVLRSSDGGRTYEPVFPQRGYDARVNGHAWRVLDLKNGKLVATSSPWNDDANQAVVLDEKEKSPRFVRTGLPENRPVKNTMWEAGFPRALASDAAGPSTLYMGIDGDDGGGLFVSQDGGISWKRSAGQPGSRRIYNALAADPSQPGRLYWGAFGEEDGGVYVSADGGLTWQWTLQEMRKVFDIAVDPGGRVYAAGEMGHASLYVSEDRGQSWKLLKSFPEAGTCEALALDSRHPDRIALSTMRWDGIAGDALYLSEDRGLTWTRINGDLPHGRGAAAMVFDASGYLYMASQGGGIYRTQVPEPGGVTVGTR